MNSEAYESLVKDHLRYVSRKYLDSLRYVQIQNDFATDKAVTAADVQREIDKANITSEMCLDFLDSMVKSRLDYIIRDRVEHLLAKEQTNG